MPRADTNSRPKRAEIWENLGTSHVDLPTGPSRSGSPDVLQPGSADRWSFHRRRARLVRASSVTLVFLLLLFLLLLAKASLVPVLPEFLADPLIPPLLCVVVFFFALRTHSDALRSMAFFGRFIRPGLKRLIDHKGELLFRGEKLFRGHKTVIMKIDIANYTRATFFMPYGMRRLFLDLWFTLIDLTVADLVFLDKSLGDGSVYCFEDQLPGGSCHAALAAAVEIRDRRVQDFDQTFHRILDQRLQAWPELRKSVERFLELFEAKTGNSFWERSTEIRIALVSGYIDEGLWGLSSRSHYDVQGKPPVLATRLEGQAGKGEIVFDRTFLEELESEAPGEIDRTCLLPRILDLKGIGKWQVFAVPLGVDPLRGRSNEASGQSEPPEPCYGSPGAYDCEVRT